MRKKLLLLVQLFAIAAFTACSGTKDNESGKGQTTKQQAESSYEDEETKSSDSEDTDKKETDAESTKKPSSDDVTEPSGDETIKETEPSGDNTDGNQTEKPSVNDKPSSTTKPSTTTKDTTTQATTSKPSQTTTTKPPQTTSKPQETTTSKDESKDDAGTSSTITVTLPDFMRAVSGGITEEGHNAAKSIVSTIIKSSMSEYEKVKTIHDYLVVNITYGFSTGNAVYTAEGALQNKEAVCQGYAEAFSLLCYYANIQTEVYYGKADNGSGEGPQSHAWNIVRIDNVWYQIDVTWDDPLTTGDMSAGQNMVYTYFLLPDSKMGVDHFADNYTKQHACTDSRYLEVGKKLTAEQFIRTTFGDVPFGYATTDDEAKAIVKNNAGKSMVIVAYDLGHTYTDADSATVNEKTNMVANYAYYTLGTGKDVGVYRTTSSEYIYIYVKF